MNILFDLWHPRHVHLFKNLILFLKKNNHNVIITTRDKDITNSLVEHLGFEYISLSKMKNSLTNLGSEVIKRDVEIFKIAKKFNIKIAIGTSISITHLSALSKVKSFFFHADDDSIEGLLVWFMYPFATKIINPNCIKFNKWKEKRILYNSYQELAYLHPNNFVPNKGVIEKYGLKENEYSIFRFSALKAHHDIHAKGLNQTITKDIENLLYEYKIIKSHENNKIHQIEPWDMHHILSFAKIIITDSQSMAAEAAVLGTPSIRYNTFVGKISYLEQLEHLYQLTFGFKPGNESLMINKIKEIIENKHSRDIWHEKKNKMLNEKIDLNKWMIEFLEKEIN